MGTAVHVFFFKKKTVRLWVDLKIIEIFKNQPHQGF